MNDNTQQLRKHPFNPERLTVTLHQRSLAALGGVPSFTAQPADPPEVQEWKRAFDARPFLRHPTGFTKSVELSLTAARSLLSALDAACQGTGPQPLAGDIDLLWAAVVERLGGSLQHGEGSA
jgi:hypothetical protein